MFQHIHCSRVHFHEWHHTGCFLVRFDSIKHAKNHWLLETIHLVGILVWKVKVKIYGMLHEVWFRFKYMVTVMTRQSSPWNPIGGSLFIIVATHLMDMIYSYDLTVRSNFDSFSIFHFSKWGYSWTFPIKSHKVNYHTYLIVSSVNIMRKHWRLARVNSEKIAIAEMCS